MRTSASRLLLCVPLLALWLGSASPWPVPPASNPARPRSPSTPDVEAAAEALAQGRPWRASYLLEPAIRERRQRTPNVVMLAATAAAGWAGWGRVDELLSAELWLDTLFGGRGRALLARAALERRADSLALRHALRSIHSAEDAAEEGSRLVMLARALDRLDLRDSARVAYIRAASRLPAIEDWLRLRAAGVTADSAMRATQYAALQTDVARARVRWVEAQARARVGDPQGAARAYETLGAHSTALRLRLGAMTSAADSGALRRELLTLVERQSGSPDSRAAADLIDRAFAPLTAGEELVIARSTAVSGPAARAAIGFARAFSAGLGTPRDRFNYATVLSRLGRDREAAAQFALVRSPSLAGLAAYQRARSLLRSGLGSDARSALRVVVDEHQRDTAAASAALFLLADLATDDRRDTAAREAFLTVARRYPSSVYAPRARFRAAIIALVAGDPRTAALELDTLVDRYPRSDDANAASYWSGRAWERGGDSAKAAVRWSGLVAREPLSYYAMVSAGRLGAGPWTPPPAREALPASTVADSALQRAALLDRLGMETEARIEYDRLAADADRSLDRLLATASALRDHGLVARAIPLAQRALARAAPRDVQVYRLLYPLWQENVLSAEAGTHQLDRALVAALIRQESGFNPHATSRAGALGLMQLMPAVGRQVAGALEFPMWDPTLLYQPDVNVQLGTTHLAALLRGSDNVVHAIAAYNAGQSRVERWAARLGAEDPEIFIERIPYTETRDYVRIVLRNREIYRALYRW